MVLRQIIASNRGPVSFTVNEAGKLSASIASPSDIPAERPVTFVSLASTPGDRTAVSLTGDAAITEALPDGVAIRLLTPSRRALHRYYNVVCNPLLWFLHHRSWGFTHTPNVDREAHSAWANGYVTVNEAFANAIAEEASATGDEAQVSVRDYHLHLVSGMVRRLLPDARISFQPGVPWPGPADWSMLPAEWRDGIFRSLVAADQVELPSKSDVRRLIACLEEFVPGAEVEGSRVLSADGHEVSLETRWPQVNRESLLATLDVPRGRMLADRLSEDSRFTFVTAERAEPHRNIVRSIRAFGTLLGSRRDIVEEIRYLLVLAPPAPHLAQYRRYVSEIKSAVREVNSRFKDKNLEPIELQLENDYQKALAALSIADCVVSVPIADASCASALSAPLISEEECLLIISETSNSAEMYGDAAKQVAPADVDGLARAMLQALDTSDTERSRLFAEAHGIALSASHADREAEKLARQPD